MNFDLNKMRFPRRKPDFRRREMNPDHDKMNFHHK